jgi:hypothetical protein
MRLRFIFLSLAFSACAALHQAAWVQDSLYFGLSSPQGPVSDADWQGFVDAEITPRFPDGLTQLSAQGQWKGSDGKIAKEASRVLILLHPATADADAKLDQLIQAYKARFHQESVLRVRQAAEAHF